ncbi:MAG TPA: hypothetical protein V6D05_04340 [Stenomitos sp.]
MEGITPTTATPNTYKPAPNFNVNEAFDRSVALQNQYSKMAEDANHVGVWQGIKEMIPIYGKNVQNKREEKVEMLKNINQLIAQIRESMARAYEGMAKT